MFNKNSGLVKIWVSLVLNGTYQLEQVPALSNLDVIVNEVIKEMA